MRARIRNNVTHLPLLSFRITIKFSLNIKQTFKLLDKSQDLQDD